METYFEKELKSNKLFKLTSDYAFKLLFGQNPDILLDLLNSFPEFSGDKQIKKLKVLNPEIPRNLDDDKLSILDILAEDKKGNKFQIEMQGFPHNDYEKRALFYWGKVYSTGIKKGQSYSDLKKVYSINFLNFDLLEDRKDFHTVFDIREREEGKIKLTDQLEIHIIELPKFKKHLDEVSGNLETWVYFIHKSQNLGGEEMEKIQKKSSALRKAVNQLKAISKDKEKRALYINRQIAELDHLNYLHMITDPFNRGKKEGILIGKEEGIQKGKEEGLKIGEQKGIQRGKEDGLRIGEQKGIQVGEKKEKQKIALSMLAKKFEIKTISELTGLTVKEIRALKKK